MPQPYLDDDPEELQDDEDLYAPPPRLPGAGRYLGQGVADRSGDLWPGQSAGATPPFLPAAPAGPSGPPPVESDYGQAVQNVARIKGQQPLPGKPNFLQLLAAGALGGMAGYSNAAGRMRRPIDPTAAEQGILAPGLGRKTAEWQRQLAGAEAEAQAAEARRTAWYQQQQLQGEVGLKQAQTEQAKAHAAYWNNKGDLITVPGGGLFDAKAGKWVREPNVKAASEANMIEITPEKGKAIGLQPTSDGRYLIPKEGIGPFLTQSAKPEKPEKEVSNPEQVLLNPGNYDSATVQTARNLFAQTHRDPNAMPGGTGSAAVRERNPQLGPTDRDEGILEGLDPGVKATVKGIVDYKLPLPSGFALRSPYWQNILGLAQQYDPSFAAALYTPRQQLVKDFTSGKSAQAINSLNTVTQHIDRLEKSWKDLNNYGGLATPLNRIVNPAESFAGDPRLMKFEQDKTAVSTELMRTWRQVGASEGEIRDWASKLSQAASPAQQNAVIDELYALIGGKLIALKNQFEQGMGRPASFSMLRPEVKARFAAHGFPAEDLASGAAYGTQGQPAAQGAGQQGSTPAQAAAKTVPRAMVQRYAQEHGVDYNTAAKVFTDKQYQIH